MLFNSEPFIRGDGPDVAMPAITPVPCDFSVMRLQARARVSFKGVTWSWRRWLWWWWVEWGIGVLLLLLLLLLLVRLLILLLTVLLTGGAAAALARARLWRVAVAGRPAYHRSYAATNPV